MSNSYIPTNFIPLNIIKERLLEKGYTYIDTEDGSEYTNQKQHVIVIHNKCKTKFTCSMLRLLNNQVSCPYCTPKSTNVTEEMFIKKLKENTNDTVEYISGYNGLSKPCNFKCKKCGNKWSIKPYSVFKSGGCPKCNIKESREKRKEKNYKLFIEAIKDKFELIGEYKNFNDSVFLKCNKCNHKWKAVPYNLVKNDTGCPNCKNIENATLKASTTDEYKEKIYELFKNEYVVLGEYVNSKTEIKMKHTKCNNEFTITPSTMLNNRNDHCPYCNNNRNLNDFSFKVKLRNLVGDEYKSLTEYKGSYEYVKMKHNVCGYKWNITPNQFLNNGYRCPLCNNQIHYRSNYEFLQEAYRVLDRKEYKILSEYESFDTPIKIKHLKCKKEFYLRPINLFKKHKENYVCCPQCSHREKRSNERFIEEVLEQGKGEYIPLEDYVNISTKVKMKHIVCSTIYSVTPSNFFKGDRCPYCSKRKKYSNVEKEIVEFIKDIYDGEIIENSRDIISPYELDIYLPDKKIAFEIDGIYYHSTKYKEDKNYHLNKTNLCKEIGIRLIHIFDDEIIEKRKIVEDKILNILGLNSNRIYARECIIKNINANEKNKFLKENHIQGKDNSEIKLGLYTNTKYYEEEVLVAVMTFCKPRIALGQKKNSIYDYELSRYCSLLDNNVIGGFSKLLKYFERNYEWNKIITYADKRWSVGDIYFKNNFKYLRDSKPSYWYINSKNIKKRIYRYQFRKSLLKTLFPLEYDDNKTEIEIMTEVGYYRLYDCGNMVFEYSKSI